MNETTQKQPIPWEKRQELGVLKALWETIKQVLFKPGEFFNNLKVKDSIVEPLIFYLIIAGATSIISYIIQALLGKGGGPAGFLFFLILMIIAIGAGIFIIAGLMHLLVMLFGGKGGFKGTFYVLAYACATNIFSIIPYLGSLLFGIWGIVVGIIGYKKIHGFSTAKAVLAYIIVPILIFILVVALGVLGMQGARRQAGMMENQAAVTQASAVAQDYKYDY